MQYGFQPDEIEKGVDYELGGFKSLGGEVLQPDGQWDYYLPSAELQALPAGDPQACVSFTILNGCETLARRVFQVVHNWSDRWLSWASGTTQSGNNYKRVLDTLRKKGVPSQHKWPDTGVQTFEDWYAEPPASLEKDARTDFLDLYALKYEVVGTTEAELKEALKYSPVLVSVSAWHQDDYGAYYSPAGVPNNHACLLYGYDDAIKCWKIFDSYDNTRKLYTYGSLIQQAKRIMLTNPQPLTLWQKLRAIIGL